MKENNKSILESENELGNVRCLSMEKKIENYAGGTGQEQAISSVTFFFFFFTLGILFIYLFIFPFILISWKLISLQHCSVFLPYIAMNQPWIFMCSPSRSPLLLPSHPIPLGLPNAPAPRTCLMHPTLAGDLFHPRQYTCFDAILSEHPTLAFSRRVQKSVLYICVSFSVLHIGLSLPSF